MTLRRWFRKLCERIGWIVPLGLVACTGSLEVARGPSLKIGASPPSPRCMQLDDAHRNWGAASKGSAVLAGASGLAMIPTHDDDKAMRIGLAAGSAVFAALAAFSSFESDGASESWARDCAK